MSIFLLSLFCFYCFLVKHLQQLFELHSFPTCFMLPHFVSALFLLCISTAYMYTHDRRCILKEELLIEPLTQHRIPFQHYQHYAPYFLKRWEDVFASLSDDEKARIYLHDNRYFCGYLWHVFSNKLYAHDVREAAECAFLQTNKQRCYIVFQHSTDVFVVEHGNALRPEYFADCEDIYIIDEHYRWTYVVTHEEEFGPYFARA